MVVVGKSPRALYITADTVGSPGGGGSVTRHESQGLRDLFGETLVIDSAIIPPVYSQLDIPFLADHFALARLLQEDLSQVRMAHIYSGTFSLTVHFLVNLGIPVAYTCPAHDWTISRDEHLALGFPYNYPHLTDPDLSRHFFEGLRQASLVIAPSKLSERFLRSIGVDRIQVIPHGFDQVPTKVPSTRTNVIPEFTLGYLGQTGPDKGLRYLIQAWGELDYPDAKLILAGRGTDQLDGMVQKYAGAGRFELWGYVENASDLYQACSSYIQSSVTESFGIEVLEALHHGLFTLVSSGAGSSDLLESCPRHIFPPRDVVALKQAIIWCRDTMSENCVQNVEGYHWSEIIQRYKAMWLGLVPNG